jgi:hypothetical protein
MNKEKKSIMGSVKTKFAELKKEEVVIVDKAKEEKKEIATVDTNIALMFLSSLSDLLIKISKRVITVTKASGDYTIPQAVILMDPRTMKPLNPADLVSIQSVSINGIGGTSGSSGIAQSVAIRGAGAIGDGTTTVTTAGTRVQLPTVSVSRVYLQANPSNTGEIVVGSSSVVASSSTRRGVAVFATQWVEFKVDNLNKLYIDSTVSGDKINYTYEV